MSTGPKKPNSLKAEHSLGKGEVDSSILSGSTRILQQFNIFSPRGAAPIVSIAQNGTRNAHVDPWKIRGLCSAAVHADDGVC